MQELPKRKRIRLEEYDYATEGAYFVTFCVKDRKQILSTVGEHSVLPELSILGLIVDTAINNISQIYDLVTVDKYVIMPNHVHMIIFISPDSGRTMCAPTISRVIKQLKEYVTKQIGYSIWQKSFYDHVLRNEEDYQVKWNYIDTNPMRWADDEYY